MNKIISIEATGSNIPLPPVTPKNGEIIRWGKNKRFYAIGFENGLLVGDWTTNCKAFKRKNGKNSLTKEEKEKISNIQSQKTKEREERQKQAAIEVRTLWRKLPYAQINHPYLKQKGLTEIRLPADIKQDDGNLVVPLYDSQGQIQSCQSITAEGIKKFYKAARRQGLFYPFENLLGEYSIIGLCEGWATGASLKACLGEKAFIAVTCGVNNLFAVAANLQEVYPGKTLVIFADNDIGKSGNIGLKEARKVASLIRPSRILFPSWTPEIHQSVDWNDIYCIAGEQVMREKIEHALENGLEEVVFKKKGELDD